MSDEARYWRSDGYSWFWTDGRETFGSVVQQGWRWIATTARGSSDFGILGDAKTFVEEHSS